MWFAGGENMGFELWLVYLAAAVGLSLTPGPNGLLALTHGACFGLRPTIATVLGGVLGFLLLIAASLAGLGALLARIIHRTARNRPRPPNTWARDFIAKNFIKQPIRIVVNDINGLALTAHFS